MELIVICLDLEGCLSFPVDKGAEKWNFRQRQDPDPQPREGKGESIRKCL